MTPIASELANTVIEKKTLRKALKADTLTLAHAVTPSKNPPGG